MHRYYRSVMNHSVLSVEKMILVFDLPFQFASATDESGIEAPAVTSKVQEIAMKLRAVPNKTLRSCALGEGGKHVWQES